MSDAVQTEEPSGSKPPHQISRKKRLLFSAIMVAFMLLLAEGVGQLALRVFYGPEIPEDQRLSQYDPELGWVNVKNRHFPDRYGENKHVTHNSQGFRAVRDYPSEIPKGRHRIVCLGDSFTYGIVGDNDTFPAQLETLCPAIETVNMGGPGYGIDQAYLWYKRDGSVVNANLLLFAFIEDDFQRMAMEAFMTRYPKPQLMLNGNDLVPANVPVPTWGGASNTGWLEEFPRKTALFQTLRKTYVTLANDYDVFPVAERVFDNLNEESRKRNQKLVLVYLPTKKEIMSAQPTSVSRWVQTITEQKQIPFLNLTGEFKTLSAQELALHFAPDGHLSERGNRLVAEKLLDELKKVLPDASWNSCSDFQQGNP